MSSRRWSIVLAGAACLLFGTRARAATITVSTLTDAVAADGACSFREALSNANANNQSGSTECAAGAGADTIVFSVDGTITLTGLNITLQDAAKTTIDGTGRAIVLDGNDSWRLLAIASGAVVELRKLTITRGKGATGGGVDSSGALSVFGCTFLNNGVGTSSGGALRINAGGTLTVVDSTFSGNRASTNAIMEIKTTGTVDIRGSTFIGNRPGANCGIGVGPANVTISNSTFFDNIVGSGYSGGAICTGSGSLTVIGSTFRGNTAATLNGGTIYNGGGPAPTVRNSIIDGTPGTTGACSGAIIDGGGNIDTGTSCGFTTTGGSFPSTPSGLDPAGPKDDGGATKTIALLPGSAAIDRGDPATCAAAPISGLDQRGVTRPLDGDGDGTAKCDIGAFEAPIPDAGPSDTGTVMDAAVDSEIDTGVIDSGAIDSGPGDAGPATDVLPQDPAKPPVVEGDAKSCTTSAECASGFCVDHVCCNEACNGPCRSCALPQAPGLCALQPLGYDLRNECSSDRPCFETCAKGACAPSFPGARCDNNRCTGPSTGRGAAVCSALAGECRKDDAIAFDCAPYACAPAFGACLRDCTSTTDCAPGNVCDVASKRCVAAPGEGDDGGCAYRSGEGGAYGALLAAALLLLGRTRRRRDRRAA